MVDGLYAGTTFQVTVLACMEQHDLTTLGHISKHIKGKLDMQRIRHPN